jgi:hypothetical protein
MPISFIATPSKNLPKMGFWSENVTSGNPAIRHKTVNLNSVL